MTANLNNALRNELRSTLDHIDNISSKELVNVLEGIYEKALLADYLNDRNQRSQKVQNRVLSTLATLDKSAPKSDALKEEETTPFAESAFHLSPEIKVVPHPDGPPPMPRDLEDTPEKMDQNAHITEPKAEKTPVENQAPEPQAKNIAEQKTPTNIAERAQEENKKKSLNAQLAAKALTFGLNDRLAFVKHLFEGNAEDFNRVVSQINTLDSWGEANDFIENMIKPDYNWDEKAEFEERFVTQVKSRFE